MLYVGENRTKFVVHKQLICDSSDFFRKGFTGNFLESQQGIMYLPEDQVGSVSLFIDWLYRSAIPIDNTETHLHNLYDLYNLADKLCLTVLKDQTVDCIQDMCLKYNLIEMVTSSAFVSKTLRSSSDQQGYYYYQRAIEDPDTFFVGLDEEKENKSPDDNGRFLYLKHEDLVNLLEICKADRTFVGEVLNRFSSNIQSRLSDEYLDLDSPFMRDEEVKNDRCFFHCHKEADNCRAEAEIDVPFFRDA
ncbi:hypothetical protein LSUE1_G003297 [Lachnellula suecica]|uniref:BTB domain-containing protein n=1 Tax=Lachnellula suecica TaxID=602035 RepID=A0A8T9CJ64_9HELO|nr:hypothetical protein LSUE1_G003297 [Lachnellula suecica]